ncbi:50S ribosomal protein L15 [Patescibacteria group bacterium]|nr:50S ribosomal protein L15 [Patescibacteria group bacterium]
MQTHQLKPIHKPKKEKRIGRGGKRGRYCGKGIKGQKSRAGRKMQPIIRGLIKRYPKLRGYRYSPREKLRAEVNLSILEKQFEKGEKITPEILVAKKIIHKIKGKMPEIKILGKGEITKNLIIEGCKISMTAKDKVEKAGGKINLKIHLPKASS